MSKASFLYLFDLGNRDILSPGSNIISVTSTADGDFDKANLTTDALRQVWRSSGVIGWQEIVIKADLKTRIDTFAILGHNFSELAVVKVEANIADNWIAPPFSKTVPWSRRNMVLCSDFLNEYEYYRVRVLDPANPCGYIEIGRIVGGRAFTFVGDEDITDNFEVENDDLADTVKTEGFHRASNERVKVRGVKAKFEKFRTIPGEDANYKGFLTMIDNVGVTRPLVFILDRGDPGFVSLWCQFDKMPSISHTINRYASGGFAVTEMF